METVNFKSVSEAALRALKVKLVDRGNRSAAGCQRDDYQRRLRRATSMRFESVADRWEKDSKSEYEFRRNMMANGWTRETIEEIDRIANAPGQPEPKVGQGRNGLARAQHEGWYSRVDGHGAAPEEERLPHQIPEYVHDRNARRRAETTIATGRLPSLGRGKFSYKRQVERQDRSEGRSRQRKGREALVGGDQPRLGKPVVGSAGRVQGNDG